MTLSKRPIVFACFMLAACGGGSPPSPNDGETITGVERLGWDQRAADAGELASFRYAVYVDEARSEASDVTCAAAQSSAGFACTSRLPAMSNGGHTLQVAAFVLDGGAIRESTRSAAVHVT